MTPLRAGLLGAWIGALALALILVVLGAIDRKTYNRTAAALAGLGSVFLLLMVLGVL